MASLQKSVEAIQSHVEKINVLMAELYSNGVEVRISYKDPGANTGVKHPTIELWRATHHVDLLKTKKQGQDE